MAKAFVQAMDRKLITVSSMVIGKFFLLCTLLIASGCASSNVHKGLVFVDHGEAQTVVIIADNPNPVARYAARELVDHVNKASGVTLKILSESEAGQSEYPYRIFLGETAAAAQIGINPASLGDDAFLLRSVGSDLYVVGKEDELEPLGQNTQKGTLFGVYELIERHLGVLWLWPGELGTYVPKSETIVISLPLDEVVEPVFEFRRARINWLNSQVNNPNPQITRIGFSENAARNHLASMHVFQARYRLGYDKKPRVGHHFSGWWQRHGEENPEWFMLNEQGERGPLPGGSTQHVAMCVSNQDLHRYIIENDWDGSDVLSLGEVDVRTFCNCERCLSWDGPQPEKPPEFAIQDYQPRLVTDRYARFWKTIYDQASMINPNVRVTTFLYWNYFPAPLGDVQLNKNFYGEFVPWTGPYVYFPMPDERIEWKKEQWLRWSETGISMAYRPNHPHGGYVFPDISTWQAGEFFRFAYKNGMIGFDYDQLFGHWATKGPMLYVQMRLYVDPTLEIQQIREDYFSAFGPAAAHVEEYFDFWEENSGVYGANPNGVVEHYPDDMFRQSEPILEHAMEAARQNENHEYAGRVHFLQTGLEHARLAAHLWRSTDRGAVPDLPPGALGDDGFAGAGEVAELPADVQRYHQIREALADLVTFRRKHEHLFFSDLVDAARREIRWIELDQLIEQLE